MEYDRQSVAYHPDGTRTYDIETGDDRFVLSGAALECEAFARVDTAWAAVESSPDGRLPARFISWLSKTLDIEPDDPGLHLGELLDQAPWFAYIDLIHGLDRTRFPDDSLKYSLIRQRGSHIFVL